MTTHPQTEPTAVVTAHTIRLLVTGQPDVKNKFGTGHIRPDNVRLNYRGTHIDARVSGAWVREDGELTDAPIDQPYATDRGDMAGWPDWLAGLATAARGMVATAAVSSVPACPDPIECSHEAALGQAQEIASRLAAHAVGFQDVLDDSDRGPWGRTVGADIAALCAALAAVPAAVEEQPEPPARNFAAYQAAIARVALVLREAREHREQTDPSERQDCVMCGADHFAEIRDAIKGKQPDPNTPQAEQRQSCACGQDGCEYCDVDESDDEQPEDGPRTVCVCGHTRGEHVTVSGRLLCDECDPDSTDNLVCKEFEAL